ncbi:MAG: TadG family pilus assembly protein, partial [Thermoguttaceae bacterium]
MNAQKQYRRKKGSILVLTAVLMVAMFAFLAFAVDLGYLEMVQTELQRSADASAIAAGWSLIDGEILYGLDSPYAVSLAKGTAQDYVTANLVVQRALALADEDVTAGYLSNPFDPNSQFVTSGVPCYNAIRVRVRMTDAQNNSVPLFFAKALGINSADAQAQATAAFLSDISGFNTPSDGENLGILPFAIDEDTWNQIMAGQGTDDWSYNSETGEVTSGQDTILEGNLFPQGSGSPGNRGTVDIGSPNNSTADIARQILHGVSAEDLSYLGGKLALDENGTLLLNGDTGISAGVKDELADIKGQPRILPVFNNVTGPGNNATYTIVKFVGVRIMEVHLTGSMSGKRVVVQPAPIYVKGAIPSTGGQSSNYIFSPVCLVR